MKSKEFAAELKKRFLAPKNIQFSNWHDWTIVSSYNEESFNFISESVAMGIDKNPEIALMKSLTEFCERHVFKTSEDPAIKITKRSDGIAAYPTNLPESQTNVRDNAFNEAVERYLWSSWWDNEDTEYSIEESNIEEKYNIKKEFNVINLFLVSVNAKNSDVSLKILLAENKLGGFVTGGAAGKSFEIEKTYARALGELLRHLLVIKNMTNNSNRKFTFYEQRLWGFGSGEWKNIVLTRLNIKGTSLTVLPSLVIDKEIVHKNSDLIIVHRCLLKDQPIFMGGKLERLCI